MHRPALFRIVPAAAVGVLVAASVGCGRDGELAKNPGPFTTPEGVTNPSATTTGRTSTSPRTSTTPRTSTSATTTPRTTTTGTTPTTTTATDPFAKPPPADVRLRNTAVRYARNRFGVATRSADVTLRRSRRSPAWAIASAADGRTLWVVWLKNGEVALATTNVQRFNPPSVPCDLRPAFSEPGC